MTKHTFFIKANSRFVSLIEDLAAYTKDISAKRGINLSLLRYAKRKIFTYHFLRNKKVHHAAFSEIIRKTTDKHPHIMTARVVDLLSELVNTTVADAVELNRLTPYAQLGRDEKNYLHTYLIHTMREAHYIPRHAWFMPIQQQQGLNTWEAKDLTTNHTLFIEKQRKGDFWEYAITKPL